jgi:hypothetical protein
MAKLILDFENTEQRNGFPRHGWARNSQGVKLLWLPIIRLFRSAQVVRNEKGVKPLEDKDLLDIEPFCKTTRKLALTLREIHELIRKSPGPPSIHENPEDWRQFKKVHDMLPLYIDLAYVYLRRLADHLTIASRLVLFEHYKSAPREFKELIAFVANQEKISQVVPICDLSLLERALTEHSSWFDCLRQGATENERTKKGIRDAMEHRPATVEILYEGNEPKLVVFLFSRSRDVDSGQELITTLQGIVSELCNLWTGIQASVGWGNKYELRDHLPLTGTDDDFTGFWPEI